MVSNLYDSRILFERFLVYFSDLTIDFFITRQENWSRIKFVASSGCETNIYRFQHICNTKLISVLTIPIDLNYRRYR